VRRITVSGYQYFEDAASDQIDVREDFMTSDENDVEKMT